ncbi:hypothetical protein ACET3Z_010914 [Daucus carota]
MVDLGGEVSYHNFHPQSNYFHPLHFFSSVDPEMVKANYRCSSNGVNIIRIAKAPRSVGKEAIVLVTPYNSTNISLGEAMALGIVYSVFSLFTQVSWLAKDIIWVAVDSRRGEYASIFLLAKRLSLSEIYLSPSIPVSYGIETAGGVMTELIPIGTPDFTPIRRSCIFTTKHDQQTTVSIKAEDKRTGEVEFIIIDHWPRDEEIDLEKGEDVGNEIS